uniref:Uncharacterized protein n=1 Tax=Arundo donax TaxID=35708 RepID=A0A0A9FY39_ARUDO
MLYFAAVITPHQGTLVTARAALHVSTSAATLQNLHCLAADAALHVSTELAASPSPSLSSLPDPFLPVLTRPLRRKRARSRERLRRGGEAKNHGFLGPRPGSCLLGGSSAWLRAVVERDAGVRHQRQLRQERRLRRADAHPVRGRQGSRVLGWKLTGLPPAPRVWIRSQQLACQSGGWRLVQ